MSLFVDAGRLDGGDHAAHLLRVGGQGLASGRSLRLDADRERGLVGHRGDGADAGDGDAAGRLLRAAGRLGPADARESDDGGANGDEDDDPHRFHVCSFSGSVQIRRRAAAASQSSRALPVRRLPLGAREPGPRTGALPRRTHSRRFVPRRGRGPRGPARASAAGIRFPTPATSPPPPRAPESARASSSSPTANMGGAERLWWLLRHFGHDDCAVIDLDAWLGPLAAGEEEIEPAVFEPRPRDGRHRGCRRARRPGSDELVVVDARLPERFRGEPNPIDKVPGRIPGARQRAVERACARATRAASSSPTAAPASLRA